MAIHDWTHVYVGLFHDFHQSWSVRITDALNCGLLPDRLAALVEQSSGSEEPSTQIVRKSAKEHYAERANRIVVKHNLGRTVAVIEIVSPGNRDSKPAFKEFLDKSLSFIDAAAAGWRHGLSSTRPFPSIHVYWTAV